MYVEILVSLITLFLSFLFRSTVKEVFVIAKHSFCGLARGSARQKVFRKGTTRALQSAQNCTKMREKKQAKKHTCIHQM